MAGRAIQSERIERAAAERWGSVRRARTVPRGELAARAGPRARWEAPATMRPAPRVRAGDPSASTRPVRQRVVKNSRSGLPTEFGGFARTGYLVLGASPSAQRPRGNAAGFEKVAWLPSYRFSASMCVRRLRRTGATLEVGLTYCCLGLTGSLVKLRRGMGQSNPYLAHRLACPAHFIESCWSGGTRESRRVAKPGESGGP